MAQELVMIRDKMSDTIIKTARSIATLDGVKSVTVRNILRKLNITNRVFYNRFHNIEEVLSEIYRATALKIRESIFMPDPARDFFEQVTDIVTSTLIMSYDNKMNMSQYVFESDSVSDVNCEWWLERIKKIIEYAIEKGFIKKLDTDVMSYAIWCFIRGYNADALARGIPKDEAVKNFRYSFGIFLDGMKNKA